MADHETPLSMQAVEMASHLNFVAGEFVDVGPDADLVINPVTEKVIGDSGHASVELVEGAIDAAAVAQRSWGRSTPAERAELLLGLADCLAENADELAVLETQNVGMPIGFSEAIVAAAVDALRYFAGAARTVDGLATGEYVHGMTSFLRREPIGVVAQLLPWNVPLLMAAWKLGPALAAGNSVVIKPSTRTPLTLLRFASLASDLIPTGVVNVVTGTHETVVGTLARSPDVRMIALTGSVDAGVAIATLAANTVKRLHLELGGNTAVIVCADADLDAATERIVQGALDNSGQDCTAASRVMAEASIVDELTARLADRLERVRVGDPMDRATEMGPLISAARRDSVLRMLDRARGEGVEIATGGSAPAGKGFYLEPTLVLDPDGRSSIANHEIFGPVMTVERWTDQAEVVERANGSEHGLAAGVWTTSMARALAISRDLEAGKIWINEHHRDATEMPHGGMKRSGYGSDLSTLAVQEYTSPKAIHARFE